MGILFLSNFFLVELTALPTFSWCGEHVLYHNYSLNSCVPLTPTGACKTSQYFKYFTFI